MLKVSQKVYESIEEKIEDAFRRSYKSDSYFTVYLDTTDGEVYIFESVNSTTVPERAWNGYDVAIESFAGILNGGGCVEEGDPYFQESLRTFLTEDEIAQYEKHLAEAIQEDIRDLGEDLVDRDKDFENWVKKNTNAYEEYCEAVIDNAWGEYANDFEAGLYPTLDKAVTVVEDDPATSTPKKPSHKKDAPCL